MTLTIAGNPLLEQRFPDREWEQFAEDAIEDGTQRLATIPPRYATAEATDPDVLRWGQILIGNAVANSRTAAIKLSQGPSLLMLGPTGTGKTYQAYGLIRALALSGLRFRWVLTTAADAYARMRPRHGADSEAEFAHMVNAGLLVIDDLGAAKTSEWVEEVNYRLINRRYEQMLPTLITSNVPVAHLKAALGDRVTSRLAEMADRVILEGADRRRAPHPSRQETAQ